MELTGLNIQRLDHYLMCPSEHRAAGGILTISFIFSVWFDSGDDEALYIVNDYSPHCNCPANTSCSFQLTATVPNSAPLVFEATQGSISRPLSLTGISKF